MQSITLRVISLDECNVKFHVSNTHRYTSFYPNKDSNGTMYLASNGIVLQSFDYPEWRANDITKRLFVQGTDRTRDNVVLTCHSDDWCAICDAVNEYNNEFKSKSEPITVETLRVTINGVTYKLVKE